MKPTFITDEFSQDFGSCLDVARSCGIDAVEVRSVGGASVADTGERSAGQLRQMASDAGIGICGLDTFCFKHAYDGRLVSDSLDRLDRAVDIACRLAAPWVRVFAFWREGDPGRAAVRDTMLAASRVIGGRPVRILVENGAFSTVGRGAALTALLDDLDRLEFGALWDPANVVNGGWAEDVADGLRCLAPHIVHIHAKNPQDGEPGSMRFGPLRTGMIDWLEHLKLCGACGIDGYVSLETHWRSDTALIGRDQLDFPKGHDFSAGGETATAHSLDELVRLTDAAAHGPVETAIRE